MTVHVFESGPRLRVVASIESGHPVGGFWHHTADLKIHVSLAAPVTCTVNGRARTWSVMHADAEPLEELTWWTMSELWDSELIETDASSYLFLGTVEPARDRAWRQIRDIRRFIAERAARGMDPGAAALVDGLDNLTAYFAYTALLDDATGRIAQMIRICPNVFTLVAGSSQGATQVPRITRAVCDGVNLSEIVKDALAIGLGAYRPQGCARMLNRHANALVRGLPPLALDDLLLVLHAPGADINDLHAAGECGATWARFIAAWSRRARYLDDVPRTLRLGGFLSRHAVLLCEQFHSPDEILDWLDRTRAPVPGRSTPPTHVLEQVNAWHHGLWELEFVDETPLMPGPTTTKVIAGIEPDQLLTVGALVAEGARMHHCVASLAGEAVGGESFIYRADVLGASITIDLRRCGDGWRIHEAAGFENRRPTLDEMCLIDSWVRVLR